MYSKPKINISSIQKLSVNVNEASSEEVPVLKNEINDLKEKLETLKLKRAEDREKLREIDKQKMQIQQVTNKLQ